MPPKTTEKLKTPGVNHTGIERSPHAERMSEITQLTQPTEADPRELDALRLEYAEEAPSLGTRPPSKDGAARSKAKLPVLLDKIGERLAFERMGTRLYEGILLKHAAEGGFPGGPQAAELERFRDEEAQHFLLLDKAMRRLGGDPTALTPAADLAAVESSGIGKAIQDPRVKLPEALHALLVAELVDREGWDLLIQLAQEAADEETADAFARAQEEEERHLESVRRWVTAHLMSET